MKTTILVAILALALAGNAFGASFSKRTLSDARVGNSKAELQAQIGYSARVAHFFAKHSWMIAARHANCWSHVPWAKTCNKARIMLRLHRGLYLTATERMNRLYPPRPAYYDAFLCIHRGEGAWTSNTGNGFYGGLQEDMRFQQEYGAEFLARWGTADNWPVWAQITAASRAVPSRGFTPWPYTARACGLL